jgi:hypothetical protein
MRLFCLTLAILFTANVGVAGAACTKAPAVSIQQFAPLSPAGGSIQPYYCAASPAALSVGDLSPSEWLKRVQVCTTNCTYQPANPSDPRSTLMSMGCGPGYHSIAYYVDPPRQPVRTATSISDSCVSNGLVPSKGAPASPRPNYRG